MKTPKRKGTSTPPDSVKDYEQRARWKRKNREAQLKHNIARLQQHVRHLKRRRHQALRIITSWRAWANKVYE